MLYGIYVRISIISVSIILFYLMEITIICMYTSTYIIFKMYIHTFIYNTPFKIVRKSTV